MRYDIAYQNLARRAVAQSTVDIEAFFRQMQAAGVPDAEIAALMLADLENDGPIFGKLFRSLTGAAESSVMAAERQGSRVGALIESDAAVRRVTKDDVLTGAIFQDASAEALEAIERSRPAQSLTWVAELRNTCHRCLPLHGRTLTAEQWQSLGFLPETIHSGWTSACHCQLVEVDDTAGVRKELQSPLKRNKDAAGIRGGKKTIRGVTQRDVDTALQRRNEALQSEEGRRVLRQLGQSGG